MKFPLKDAILQGNLDAAGFQILNLNLAGLNLNKNSVGLGNVDNTSDVNKPVSTAQQTAIFLREPAIAEGTTSQYWRGDKTWQELGALALVGGSTGLPLLAARGANATSDATLRAERNDFGSSGAASWLQHYGASHAGSILGISAANAGLLEFHGGAFGFIKTNNSAPIVFGVNNVRRMRLMTGLNVGGDTDPGAGGISATGTINAPHFTGDDLVLTGDIACQDLACSGSSTFAGAVTTTLGVNVGQNLAVGGNMVATGFILGRPAHLADAAVANDTLFYSTDGSKLSYKDGAGVVHALY